MDRRTGKTRTAIVNAYKQILRESGVITVQRIIDLADIGRSTFYSHFSDKSSLPKEIFEELFSHIGNQTPIYPRESRDLLELQLISPEELTTPKKRLERFFAHLLKHLEREKLIYSRLFDHAESEWFYYDFHVCFENFMRTYILGKLLYVPEKIPEDLYLQYLVDSFLTMVRWYYSSKKSYTPYKLAQFYVWLIYKEDKS